jgi:hypothetical protein
LTNSPCKLISGCPTTWDGIDSWSGFYQRSFKGTASLDYGFRSLYLSTAIPALIVVFPPLWRFEILLLSLLHLFYTFWQAEIIFPGSSCSPVSFSLHAHFTGSGSIVSVILLTLLDDYTPWLWECWTVMDGFVSLFYSHPKAFFHILVNCTIFVFCMGRHIQHAMLLVINILRLHCSSWNIFVIVLFISDPLVWVLLSLLFYRV